MKNAPAGPGREGGRNYQFNFYPYRCFLHSILPGIEIHHKELL